MTAALATVPQIQGHLKAILATSGTLKLPEIKRALVPLCVYDCDDLRKAMDHLTETGEIVKVKNRNSPMWRIAQ